MILSCFAPYQSSKCVYIKEHKPHLHFELDSCSQLSRKDNSKNNVSSPKGVLTSMVQHCGGLPVMKSQMCNNPRHGSLVVYHIWHIVQQKFYPHHITSLRATNINRNYYFCYEIHAFFYMCVYYAKLI